MACAQGDSFESIQLAEQRAVAIEHASQEVRHALVQVRVIGEFRGVSSDASGVTTGVLVDRQWVISSSFGLTTRPEVLLVTLASGDTVSAAVHCFDEGRKIALLRLAKPLPDAPAQLEPRDSVEPGETAVALAAAYSPSEPCVSVGVVSATGRFLGRAVQTDAATSPANYGGLLIDLRGRVLGVLTPLGQESGQMGAQLYDSGIGFAIPLSDILDRLPRMAEGDDLQPGKAGLDFGQVNAYTDPPRIKQLAPEGPAAVAGLRPGDVLVGVGGADVATLKQLQIAMGPYDAGDTVTLRYRRDEADAQVELKLVAASELKQPEQELPSLLKRLKLDLPQAD